MHLARARRGVRGTLVRWVGLVCILALAVPLLSGLPPASAAPVLHEQTDARFAFSGAWLSYSSPSLSGGSHAFSNNAGAGVTLAFVGTRLDLVGMKGPKFGMLAASVDGAAATTTDLYSTDTLFQQVVYTTGDLPAGLHVVRFSPTGTKNAAASDAYVSVDAVVVEGTLTGTPAEQTDTRIVRRGSWATYSAAGLSGGSHMFSNTAGTEYAIAFTGTRLDLVGMVGPKFGIAAVSVDGAAPVDVDFYASASAMRQLVWSTGDLAPGAHTVRVSHTGRRNASATDTYVGLDAALVTGTLTQAVMRYEETEPRFGSAGQLSEAWSSAFSGGRYVWAGPAWGAVAVSFVGNRLDWIGITGPQFGIASVSIDGNTVGQVDLYSPSVQTRRTVYSTGELAWGLHTVVIGWSGQKNPAATGTYISYDAFDIGGEPVQASPPVQPVFLTFNYPWDRYIVVDKSDLRIYYVVNGALAASYPCATGKPSTPTPNGTWRIGAKYYTDPGSVYGPRKMRLFRQSGSTFVFTAYNMHGTNNDASIGTYASHGCIRMHNYDVIPFFDMVPLGTMVVTRP
ncbi:MAG: murein L,D-transpeptidase [Actinobacteria bacterium]|nr:murein L,D-transpeptidase [Actinomycetota bacterium]